MKKFCLLCCIVLFCATVFSGCDAWRGVDNGTYISKTPYIKYISELNITKKSSTKEYYIIISKNKENNIIDDIIKNELKENFFKIKECLSRCGNQVNEISSKDEIIKILYSFFNTRKNLY